MFKVLIVDDNESNLYTLECLLKQYDDIKVFSSQTGDGALDLLEGNEIDLIIIDIQMPGMNGFEFCNRLSVNQKYKDIPFIFLTAFFKNEEFEQNGYKLGAFDYITKPIDESRLLGKIKIYKKAICRINELIELNKELVKKNQELTDELRKSKK